MRPGVALGVLGCPGVIRPTRIFGYSDHFGKSSNPSVSRVTSNL